MFTRLLTLTLILVLSSAGHTGHAQTTMEEYNYISKGLRTSAELGLSIKEGYELGKKQEWTTPVVVGGDAIRRTAFVVIYRTATKEPVGLFLSLKRTDTNFLKTVCIPMPSSSAAVMNLAVQDFALAASEWSEQARAYYWQLAMMLAQNIERGSKPSAGPVVAASPAHPIDRQMENCLSKVDYDRGGSDFVAPDHGCLSTALNSWTSELKAKEAALLARLSGEDKGAMAANFKQWEATNDMVSSEMGLDSFGGSMNDSAKLRAEIELVKARVGMIETYIGILSEGGE
jgi:hypothetical protein